MSSFYTSVERYGSNILWRGYENGKAFSRKVKYQPTLYLPTKQETPYRSLIGDKPIAPKKLDSMADAKEFIEKYDGVSGFDIYGSINYVTQFIQEKYPHQIKFDMSLVNIMSFDIEIDISDGYADINTADKEITSIALKSSKKDTYHLLGRKDYDRTKTITGIDPGDISFEKFDTEEALLLRFIKLWSYDYPDIVTGWNVEYFDVMYIVTRIIRLLGQAKANELSPWGSLHKKTREIFNRMQSTYEISGISVIDYMDAFKKFGYKYGTQESYKLDHIAYSVLGEKKLDYSEYGSLTSLYEQNPQLFLDYNLKDTHLIERLEEETALLSLVLTVAYGGGVNYSDAFGTVGIWESILYRKLMEKKIVPPVKSSPGEKSNDLVGGYVKDPVTGMNRWIVSFDLNSLYPHLMLQYNMSPETFVKDLRDFVSADLVLEGKYQNEDKAYAVCANGVKFRKDILGIIPEIIEEYYGNRKKIKNEMLHIEQDEQNEKDSKKKKDLKREIVQLHNAQMAIKIQMNSLYGAMANRFFLYYIMEVAEAITTSGQLSIRYAQKSVNEYMNKILKTKDIDYIIYCDTDSIYVNFAPLIEKTFGTIEISREQGEAFIDKVCKEKIEAVITSGYEELANKMGAYRNAMSMKREKITDRSLFIAKKRYILNVLNSEGVHYAKPKIAVTGIESIRSSTPEICRGKMTETFGVIMTKTEEETQKYIEDFRKEFYNLPVEEIAKISGTDDIEKFKDKTSLYKKGCPIHVRGCILFNNFLEKKKLDKKYTSIQSGDKVKFVYLKLPNPLHENVISFTEVLPKEFELEKYIDYETQFEKVFLNPIELILESVGWSSSKIDTLESFFT